MIRRIAILLVLALFSVTSYSSNSQMLPLHPDPQSTPGELCDTKDEDFTGYRYKEKIPYCQRNVSSETKSDIYGHYEVQENVRRNYTIDHLIPLSIGGSNNISNLWPEHKKIKQLRINLETEVYEDVRAGRMSQSEAILKIIKAKMNPPLFYDLDYIEITDSVN